MRLPHLKFVIAGAAIIAAICYLMFSGINDSMVYYYTVSEVKARQSSLDGRHVRISGHVLPGSIVRDPSESSVAFDVYEKETNETFFVTYQGIIPDTFKDHAEVVVEGQLNLSEPSFQATTLLAKCPSKYEELGDEHPSDYPAISSVQ